MTDHMPARPVRVRFAPSPTGYFHVGGAKTSLYNWIFQHGFAPLASPKNASLLFALAALLVLYAVLELLYRRRWFLRA